MVSARSEPVHDCLSAATGPSQLANMNWLMSWMMLSTSSQTALAPNAAVMISLHSLLTQSRALLD